MSHEDLPVFEIKHFEALIPQMLSGSLRYIICRTQEDMHFVLHADATEGTHVGVAAKANVDHSSVIGGGFVAWGGEKFTLRGSSKKFNQEPENIRLAFINLLNEKFHNDLQGFIESCKRQKEG